MVRHRERSVREIHLKDTDTSLAHLYADVKLDHNIAAGQVTSRYEHLVALLLHPVPSLSADDTILLILNGAEALGQSSCSCTFKVSDET